ncbi:hypothetical protein QJQ45_028394 [Haematococcus lacustris]|nr:hypothetical protein QJQ45_028394 [Haematococcus lacustris]
MQQSGMMMGGITLVPSPSSNLTASLFVKGLAKGATERHLHAVFSQFGAVMECQARSYPEQSEDDVGMFLLAWPQIARHRSGRSAGFAIVSYNKREEAALALHAADGVVFLGRRLNIRWYSSDTQHGNVLGPAFEDQLNPSFLLQQLMMTPSQLSSDQLPSGPAGSYWGGSQGPSSNFLPGHTHCFKEDQPGAVVGSVAQWHSGGFTADGLHLASLPFMEMGSCYSETWLEAVELAHECVSAPCCMQQEGPLGPLSNRHTNEHDWPRAEEQLAQLQLRLQQQSQSQHRACVVQQEMQAQRNGNGNVNPTTYSSSGEESSAAGHSRTLPGLSGVSDPGLQAQAACLLQDHLQSLGHALSTTDAAIASAAPGPSSSPAGTTDSASPGSTLLSAAGHASSMADSGANSAAGACTAATATMSPRCGTATSQPFSGLHSLSLPQPPLQVEDQAQGGQGPNAQATAPDTFARHSATGFPGLAEVQSTGLLGPSPLSGQQDAAASLMAGSSSTLTALDLPLQQAQKLLVQQLQNTNVQGGGGPYIHQHQHHQQQQQQLANSGVTASGVGGIAGTSSSAMPRTVPRPMSRLPMHSQHMLGPTTMAGHTSMLGAASGQLSNPMLHNLRMPRCNVHGGSSMPPFTNSSKRPVHGQVNSISAIMGAVTMPPMMPMLQPHSSARVPGLGRQALGSLTTSVPDMAMAGFMQAGSKSGPMQRVASAGLKGSAMPEALAISQPGQMSSLQLQAVLSAHHLNTAQQRYNDTLAQLSAAQSQVLAASAVLQQQLSSTGMGMMGQAGPGHTAGPNACEPFF